MGSVKTASNGQKWIWNGQMSRWNGQSLSFPLQHLKCPIQLLICPLHTVLPLPTPERIIILHSIKELTMLNYDNNSDKSVIAA